MTAPRLSIVTPCLNRAGTIGAAIDSVLAQGHPSAEHIIVDGGSTDGTAEVLARYPHLVVIREKDRNLYDAINKGLRAARGEAIGLLNSDDLYAPGAFTAAEAALADPAVEMVLGAAEFFTEAGGREVLQQRLSGDANGLTETNVIGGITTMNAAFYRRGLIERLGPFDDRFPLSADKDFWLRLVLLDGTWRKSRKMLWANPLLQALPRLALHHVPASRYAIRKAHAPHQLSTLEATQQALRHLEPAHRAHGRGRHPPDPGRPPDGQRRSRADTGREAGRDQLPHRARRGLQLLRTTTRQ